MGQGPATGGARGGCLDAGYALTGFGRGRGLGGGFGRGGGRGFGRGAGYCRPAPGRAWVAADEQAMLQSRTEVMRRDLAEMERRLAELKRETDPQAAE